MTNELDAECLMCKKNTKFAMCHSPSGFWVCTRCGFRSSFGRYKLIVNEFGYYFEESECTEL